MLFEAQAGCSPILLALIRIKSWFGAVPLTKARKIHDDSIPMFIDSLSPLFLLWVLETIRSISGNDQLWSNHTKEIVTRRSGTIPKSQTLLLGETSNINTDVVSLGRTTQVWKGGKVYSTSMPVRIWHSLGRFGWAPSLIGFCLNANPHELNANPHEFSLCIIRGICMDLGFQYSIFVIQPVAQYKGFSIAKTPGCGLLRDIYYIFYEIIAK